jgi:AAA15 family ATPase/GTPase
MLIEFKFRNYRSFRDEAVLSMVASSDKSLPENTIPVPSFGNRHLLRSAVVYGANAAGKTNLIKAIGFVRKFVNSSMERELNTPIKATPFLLTLEANRAPSEFELTFLDDDGVRYQYGFHLTTQRIEREWLVVYPKGSPQTWFEREHTGQSDTEPTWYFGRNMKGKNNQLAELTRPDVLFLSNAAKLNHRQLGHVFEWFRKGLRVVDVNDVIPFFSLMSAAKAKEDDHARINLCNLLAAADFGISGFEVREETYTEQNLPEDMPDELQKQLVNKKHLDVYMRHPISEGKEISLPLEKESAGTQRFFALSGPLEEVLENGWTLFIDELDSSLHPLLVRHLINLFHNPQTNPKGAQLIFNTHDMTLMDCCLFRRDQIWFVEKDRQGCSHLYPLLDFSPRKDEALAKGYLMGRYGAIPFLSEPQWGGSDHAEA